MRLIGALALVLTCTAAQAQDAKLVGRWDSVDQPGKYFVFRGDGTFDYVYDPKPPTTTLRLNWKTGFFSSITFSQENGGGARSCKYKIDGDDLTIDDGSGKSCISNQPVNMAIKFKRAK